MVESVKPCAGPAETLGTIKEMKSAGYGWEDIVVRLRVSHDLRSNVARVDARQREWIREFVVRGR